MIIGRVSGVWVFGFMLLCISTYAETAHAQTPYACPKLTTTLDISSRGQEVTQLQTYLRDTGDLFGGSSSITGFFGSLTETAVKKFQCRLG